MAQFRRIFWRGGLALAALLGSGGAGHAQLLQAQTPVETLGPVLDSPFDVSFCLCLERDIQTRQAELTVRRNAYEGSSQEIRETEATLDRERPQVDVNDPAAVDAFKGRLAQLDVLKARQNQVTLPDYQAAVASYNERVAQYTGRCSGRPTRLRRSSNRCAPSLVCRLSE